MSNSEDQKPKIITLTNISKDDENIVSFLNVMFEKVISEEKERPTIRLITDKEDSNSVELAFSTSSGYNACQSINGILYQNTILSFRTSDSNQIQDGDKAAINMGNGGFHIMPISALRKPEEVSHNTICISNFPLFIAKDDLVGLFDHFGKIVQSQLYYNKQDPAVIEITYEDRNSADTACQLFNHFRMGSRTLFVKRCTKEELKDYDAASLTTTPSKDTKSSTSMDPPSTSKKDTPSSESSRHSDARPSKDSSSRLYDPSVIENDRPSSSSNAYCAYRPDHRSSDRDHSHSHYEDHSHSRYEDHSHSRSDDNQKDAYTYDTRNYWSGSHETSRFGDQNFSSYSSSRILMLKNILTDEDLRHEDERQDVVSDIYNTCSKYGKVVNVIVPRLNESGARNAIVEYDYHRDAEEALSQLRMKSFKGKPIKVRYVNIDDYIHRKFDN